MSAKEDMRIFVGGLSWNTTDRHLEDAFGRFGKVIEAQVMLERDTGRPRGFGFVTFSDQRAMDRAIDEMHGQQLDGRSISVNKAQPKVGMDDPEYGFGGGSYSSGGRGGYRSVDGPPAGRTDCFKCGRPGHFARECPSNDGGGSRFSSRPRFSSGGGGGRGDRYGGSDRYADDRYDGGRYSDRYSGDRYSGDRYAERDRQDSRDSRYGGGRGDRYGDRYTAPVRDRYPPADRYSGDRYTSSDRFPQNGYGKERGYEREAVPRTGGSDRYGSGGPARYENYRERSGPYDRPSRGAGRASSYEDRYT